MPELRLQYYNVLGLAFLRGFPKNGIYEVRTFFGLETGNWKKLRFQAHPFPIQR